MIWMKVIGWCCLITSTGLIIWSGHLFWVTAPWAVVSTAVLCSVYGYQLGRDSAFADFQKFGRSFRRAKEP